MNWYKAAYEEDKDVKGENAEAVRQKAKKHICWYLSQPTPEAMVDAYSNNDIDSKPVELDLLESWFYGMFKEKGEMISSVNAILRMAACPGRAGWTYDTGGPYWRGIKINRKEIANYKFNGNLKRFINEEDKPWMAGMAPLWVESSMRVYTSEIKVQSWSKNKEMAQQFSLSGGDRLRGNTFSVIMEANIPRNETFISASLSNRLNTQFSEEDETIRTSNSPLQVKMYFLLQELADNHFDITSGIGSMTSREKVNNFAVSVFGNDTGSRLMSNPDFMKEFI